MQMLKKEERESSAEKLLGSANTSGLTVNIDHEAASEAE